MPRESKWAKDAQEENKWDTGAHKQCNKKPNDHIESLREELAASPKRPSKLGSNNIIVGMESGMVGNGSKTAKRSKRLG